MRYAGTIPGTIEVGNNEVFTDGIQFEQVDSDGSVSPFPLDGNTVILSLTPEWEENAAPFQTRPEEWEYADNIATWRIPIRGRMDQVKPGLHTLEIGLLDEDGESLFVRLRGTVRVKQGGIKL